MHTYLFSMFPPFISHKFINTSPHLPHQESESESEESVGGEELERKLREKALLSMKRQERSSVASESD